MTPTSQSVGLFGGVKRLIHSWLSSWPSSWPSSWLSSTAITLPEHETLKAIHGPIVYVLEIDSFLNRLVLLQELKKNLMPLPVGRLDSQNLNSLDSCGICYFGLKKYSFLPIIKKNTVNEDFDRLIQSSDLKLRLIPVIISWNRDLVTEPSWWDFVSKNSTYRCLKKTIHFFRKKTFLCIFGPAIIVNQKIEKKESKSIHQTLNSYFQWRVDSLRGPVIYKHQKLIQSVSQAELVKRFIDNQTDQEKKTLYAQVKDYAVEIAPKLSNFFLGFHEIWSEWMVKQWFTDMCVKEGHVPQALSKTHTLVYLPCHRSNLDFVLFELTVYRQGLIVPHTIAGMNLNFWPIGSFLRRGGAIFMRRRFKGNILYSLVLDQIIYYLVKKGFSICVYCEGTRSRTGKVLDPKVGILQMLIKSELKLMSKPIALIPAYIGYDHVFEEEAYLKERLGQPKKKENIFGFLYSARSLFKPLQKSYVVFGQPLCLKDYVDQIPKTDHTQIIEGKSTAVYPILTQLSHDIMTSIQAACFVSYPSLFASIIVSYAPSDRIKRQDLVRSGLFLKHWLEANPFRTHYFDSEDGLQAFTRMEKSRNWTYNQDQETLEISSYEKEKLKYYHNNAFHVFLIPSILATLLHGQSNIEDITEVILDATDLILLLGSFDYSLRAYSVKDLHDMLKVDIEWYLTSYSKALISNDKDFFSSSLRVAKITSFKRAILISAVKVYKDSRSDVTFKDLVEKTVQTLKFQEALSFPLKDEQTVAEMSDLESDPDIQFLLEKEIEDTLKDLEPNGFLKTTEGVVTWFELPARAYSVLSR